MEIVVNRKLPKLAWLLRVQDGLKWAEVGDGVREIRNGFFEGGWAYCEEPSDSCNDGFYLGSGAIASEDQMTLIGPSHTCEAVYIARSEKGWIAGNSLAFVLSQTKLNEINLRSLSQELWTIRRGLLEYRTVVLSELGVVVHRFCNSIIHVYSDGRLVPRLQTMSESLPSFTSYREFLERVIADAAASFGARGYLVPLSTGYDSVCCAALAARLGGGTSFSIKEDRNGTKDAGTSIGQLLGLEVHECSRKPRAYREKRVKYKGPEGVEREEFLTLDEASEVVDFFAGMGFVDEVMRIPDDLLGGQLLLTGFHGDKVWSLQEASRNIVRGDVSGASLGELRLRTAFCHVPVPMMGCQAHDQILAISKSDELAPWRVGGRYDRPIPRRIAEEEGVPRDFFGPEKRAAATLVANRQEIAPIVLELQMSAYRKASIHRGSSHQ